MAKEVEYEHNGKQSDATRNELLIALQYLLEKCHDSQHTSKTVELVKYAEDKGMFLDRRRANSIFDTLVTFTNSKSNTLPYKVIKVKDKPRYYVQKSFFSGEEIKAIAAAIENDESVDEDKAKEYLNTFLNKVCTEAQKEQVLNKIHKKTVGANHISNTKNNIFNAYENIMDNQFMFSFRIKNWIDLCSEDCTSSQRELYQAVRGGEWLEGLVYNVIRKYNTILIYLPRPYYAAMMVKVDNIEINRDYEIHELWSTPNYTLRNCRYRDIDEYQELYYQGKTGLQREVKFKFYVGTNNENLRRIKSSYEKYFKQPMVYEIQQRNVELTFRDGTTETVVADDAVTTVTCNFSSFRKWYWESGAYENVVILNPKHWNNRLLSAITRRFQRRMEKYGLGFRDPRVQITNALAAEPQQPQSHTEGPSQESKEEKAGC